MIYLLNRKIMDIENTRTPNWKSLLYNAWFRGSLYSTECFKNDDTNTMKFNNYDKILWKYILIKFSWIIKRR